MAPSAVTKRLATLDISTQDVFAALNNQNALTPAGSVETQGPQVFIRIDGAFDALQKIRDTPIVAQGRTVKLSDIATVQRGYEDPSTFIIRNGAEPALLLGVVMRDGWNGLDLGKALDQEVTAIGAAMPLGMSLAKVTDQAVNIGTAVDEFMLKFVAALFAPESLQGKRVFIIEDVTTTGGSSMRAVDAVRKDGGEIACVITIVDRCEGATEAFAAAKLPFRAILNW